jgi:hypothetical protein
MVSNFGRDAQQGSDQFKAGTKPETARSVEERSGISETAEVGTSEGEKIGAPDTN